VDHSLWLAPHRLTRYPPGRTSSTPGCPLAPKGAGYINAGSTEHPRRTIRAE